MFEVPRSEVLRLADLGEARCRVKMTLKLPAVRLTAARGPVLAADGLEHGPS
jgi:hypothetical protein